MESTVVAEPVVDPNGTLAPSHTSDKVPQDSLDSGDEEVSDFQSRPKDLRFFLIIVGLLIATFLAALDLTAIASSLHSTDFTWIGNAYSIGSAAFIPWAGGLAHVFGRRPVLLAGLGMFFIGSAMCGAAKSMDLMLVGRTFQGVGSGFILTLSEVVLSDLVSLSERGAYQGAFGAIWALASATGPLIGGALAQSNWRWLFYMNLPLTAGVACVVGAFMKLKTPEGTIRHKLARMDWIGNLVFIPSITLLIIGLVWGGQQYAWNSAHVLAPLIIGAVGLVAWYIIERYYVEHPTVPFDALTHPTTLVGFFSISALAVFYYWPTWFQAVKGASPVASAVDFFTVAFIVAPFAMVAGGSISATQIYKPQNVIAWVFMTLGPGLMTLVKYDSPKHTWAPLYETSIPCFLAPLPPALAGRALAFLVFVRSFGNILGITVGSTVLANELGQRLPASFIATLPGGLSGAYSSIPYIAELAEPLRTEVRKAFSESIRVIWIVLIPFGGVGLVASLFMQQIKLETSTDETFGIKNKKVADAEVVADAGAAGGAVEKAQ
ncbi:hypothetical protein RQP46_001904 [Phenoliferia psychrophenolica]